MGKKKRESERKLGSVLLNIHKQEGSYLSRMFVTKHLKRYTENGTGKRPTIVPPTLLPTGVYLASTSRYCWCALTAPLHPYLCVCTPSAVCFCGTLLTVTRTGRYPASLVFREPRLSSNWLKCQSATTSPTLSSILYFTLLGEAGIRNLRVVKLKFKLPTPPTLPSLLSGYKSDETSLVARSKILNLKRSLP